MYYEAFMDNDDTSVDYNLKQKEVADALKKLDKNYEKYSIPFNDTWTDGKYYKKVTIEQYGSGSHGSRIRNAVTGGYYDRNFIVGSAYEDLFYKVTDSTGRNGRRYPLTLFYDSPDQYATHNYTTISAKETQKWLKSSQEAESKLFRQ